jgi:hypothetical protein
MLVRTIRKPYLLLLGDITPAQAFAAGARTLVIGIAPPGDSCPRVGTRRSWRRWKRGLIWPRVCTSA